MAELFWENILCQKYLHYSQHNRLLTEGDFLVVDAGPAWEDYDTDISISFPVNGKFTRRQKEIYEACKAVSLAWLDFYKPGITGFEVGAKVWFLPVKCLPYSQMK